MYDWKTSELQKYEVFSDLFCAIKSNFTVFQLNGDINNQTLNNNKKVIVTSGTEHLPLQNK